MVCCISGITNYQLWLSHDFHQKKNTADPGCLAFAGPLINAYFTDFYQYSVHVLCMHACSKYMRFYVVRIEITQFAVGLFYQALIVLIICFKKQYVLDRDPSSAVYELLYS